MVVSVVTLQPMKGLCSTISPNRETPDSNIQKIHSPADASITEENTKAAENPAMTPEELKAHEKKNAKTKAKNKAVTSVI